MPEHHQDADIFVPVELPPRQPACPGAVLRCDVCCTGAHAEEDAQRCGHVIRHSGYGMYGFVDVGHCLWLRFQWEGVSKGAGRLIR